MKPFRNLNQLSLPFFLHAFFLCQCGASTKINSPSQHDPTPRSRRAAGVALDLEGLSPALLDHASTSDTIVGLSSPIGTESVYNLLYAFFDAVRSENEEDLRSLFAPNAVYDTDAQYRSEPVSAPLFWQQRFRRLDYTQLKPEAVQDRSIQISNQRGTVVVTVPITHSQSNSTRLFGDTVVFTLRTEKDHYRIVRVVEDFRLQ